MQPFFIASVMQFFTGGGNFSDAMCRRIVVFILTDRKALDRA